MSVMSEHLPRLTPSARRPRLALQVLARSREELAPKTTESHWSGGQREP
jgi:hypothetical protein